MSDVLIREAVISDAAALAQMRCEASIGRPNEWIDFQDAEGFVARWENAHTQRQSHTLVATTKDSDEPIGFIEYKAHNIPSQFSTAYEAPDTIEIVQPVKVSAERKRITSLAYSLMEVTAKENLKDVERYFHVLFMYISPNYHRRGVGKLLMLRVLAVAQQHNAHGYLESSDAAVPFYQSLGWTLLDEEKCLHLVDAEGTVGSLNVPVLIWYPNSNTSL